MSEGVYSGVAGGTQCRGAGPPHAHVLGAGRGVVVGSRAMGWGSAEHSVLL